jgi:hypothetical protein
LIFDNGSVASEVLLDEELEVLDLQSTRYTENRQYREDDMYISEGSIIVSTDPYRAIAIVLSVDTQQRVQSAILSDQSNLNQTLERLIDRGLIRTIADVERFVVDNSEIADNTSITICDVFRTSLSRELQSCE